MLEFFTPVIRLDHIAHSKFTKVIQTRFTDVIRLIQTLFNIRLDFIETNLADFTIPYDSPHSFDIRDTFTRYSNTVRTYSSSVEALYGSFRRL